MSSPHSTQAERLTALEVRVEDMQRQQREIADKLDNLIGMRNKGIGAFWLASTLLGTGIVGFIVQLTSWWKHG